MAASRVQVCGAVWAVPRVAAPAPRPSQRQMHQKVRECATASRIQEGPSKSRQRVPNRLGMLLPAKLPHSNSTTATSGHIKAERGAAVSSCSVACKRPRYSQVLSLKCAHMHACCKPVNYLPLIVPFFFSAAHGLCRTRPLAIRHSRLCMRRAVVVRAQSSVVGPSPLQQLAANVGKVAGAVLFAWSSNIGRLRCNVKSAMERSISPEHEVGFCHAMPCTQVPCPPPSWCLCQAELISFINSLPSCTQLP